MLQRLNKKRISGNLVVIDYQFPQKNPFAFKNSEINEYLKNIVDFKTFTMYPMYPDKNAWFTHGYGVTLDVFNDNKNGYLMYYPENENKIHYLYPNKKYKFNLAYTYFLAETYVLLPFLEKNKIPFVFVLYPGGGFGINNIKSDNMLKRIFQSKYFKGVITTQNITTDYVIEKQLCELEKVHFIYGGFVQFKKNDVVPKRFYRKDKSTFDICFVAAKYSDKGVDKGYDIFIKVAKILSINNSDIRFHVVGGFDHEDIDVESLGKNIIFYGYKNPEFLANFYADMDIFLSPNRPNKLFEGNFDGFPLGIDSSYCGVALFVSDELNMNSKYRDGEDIVIIGLNPERIANSIMSYYEHIDGLYRLSYKGQQNTQTLFDIDQQINERLKVFKEHCIINLRKEQ